MQIESSESSNNTLGTTSTSLKSRDLVTNYLEALFLRAFHEKGEEAIANLKNNYLDSYGKAFNDEDCFESRMQFFTHYLLFQKNTLTSEPHNGLYFEWLSDAVETFCEFPIKEVKYSIFAVSKIKKDYLILEDLFYFNRKDRYFTIKKEEDFFLSKDQLVQTFLLRVNDDWLISTALQLHPGSLASKLRKIWDSNPETKETHLKNLSRCQLNFFRQGFTHFQRAYKTYI